MDGHSKLTERNKRNSSSCWKYPAMVVQTPCILWKTTDLSRNWRILHTLENVCCIG